MKGIWDKIDTVIFDLDGSLVDSMWMWEKIDMEYLARFGLTPPADLSDAIEGFSFTETALYFKERFSLDDPVEKIKNDWNEMARQKYLCEVPLKRGVIELLAFCREQRIKLGIATSNSRELVDSVADALGLKRYFSCIMTSCEVSRGKPWPDIYLAVAGKLDARPENCLVFEDVLAGIRAGKAAGMRVCAVDDPHSVHQEEEKRKAADYYVYDFLELL